jgi:hypothetical protein
MSEEGVVDAPDPAEKGEGTPAAAKQDMVPVSVLTATRRDLEAKYEPQIEALRAEIAALKTPREEPKKKEFTKAELDEMVAGGQLTAAAAEEIQQQQVEERITRKAEAVAEVTIESRTRAKEIDSEIKAYVERYPDAGKQHSEEWTKVKKKFDMLVGRGHPVNLATELTALELVYGDLSAKPKKGLVVREANPEGGSGSDGSERGSQDGAPRDLSPMQKKHYERLIDRGMYKDWSDPDLKKEIAFAKKKRAA